jgi:rhodanese-related sulfurtransferase
MSYLACALAEYASSNMRCIKYRWQSSASAPFGAHLIAPIITIIGVYPDGEIVAYCRGEYCVLSFEAVALLRARGFKVRRLYA